MVEFYCFECGSVYCDDCAPCDGCEGFCGEAYHRRCAGFVRQRTPNGDDDFYRRYGDEEEGETWADEVCLQVEGLVIAEDEEAGADDFGPEFSSDDSGDGPVWALFLSLTLPLVCVPQLERYCGRVVTPASISAFHFVILSLRDHDYHLIAFYMVAVVSQLLCSHLYNEDIDVRDRAVRLISGVGIGSNDFCRVEIVHDRDGVLVHRVIYQYRSVCGELNLVEWQFGLLCYALGSSLCCVYLPFTYVAYGAFVVFPYRKLQVSPHYFCMFAPARLGSVISLFVVASSLNGNNGSWTNTDDVDNSLQGFWNTPVSRDDHRPSGLKHGGEYESWEHALAALESKMGDDIMGKVQNAVMINQAAKAGRQKGPGKIDAALKQLEGIKTESGGKKAKSKPRGKRKGKPDAECSAPQQPAPAPSPPTPAPPTPSPHDGGAAPPEPL